MGGVNLAAIMLKIAFDAVCVPLEDKAKVKANVVFVSSVGPILALFDFCWLIAGSVWVFSQVLTIDHEDVNSEHYCEEAAYMFSLGLIIVSWVAAPIIAMVCCCCGCLAGLGGVAVTTPWTLG